MALPEEASTLGTVLRAWDGEEGEVARPGLALLGCTEDSSRPPAHAHGAQLTQAGHLSLLVHSQDACSLPPKGPPPPGPRSLCDHTCPDSGSSAAQDSGSGGGQREKEEERARRERPQLRGKHRKTGLYCLAFKS